MKVSVDWLKELVDLNISVEELVKLLPLRTIGLKEVTPNYIELDMKGYNRADLLSLRGVAYEVAAITNSQVKFKEEENYFWQNSDLPKADVKVENNNLASVYCIAKIQNLKVGASFDTWVKKLNDSGIRAVNNIADITNLVMVEFGQPMHAFDANQVQNETIVVRTAKDGEQLQTLDGKNRKLTSEDLLITDPQKALGLAGVMGGKNSEVSDNTTTILLEAAIFDPKTLRKTTTKLSLISEASKRFYHGLTKKRLFQALDAAIKMYEQIGGRLTALTIVDNLTQKSVTINLTQTKINSLIGVKITPDEVEDSLQKLQFKLEKNNGTWKVTTPYFRLDIGIEEDLIEEVARMYGYEKILSKPLTTNTPNSAQNPFFDLLEGLKQALFKAGLTEVQTYSYYSTSTIVNCKLKIENLIRLANPISSETEYLRTNLWPNLLEITAKNIKNGIKDVAIFEVGKVYNLQKDGVPEEHYHLSIALSNRTDNPIQELHQISQSLNLQLKGKLNNEYFHPTRQTDSIAEIHPRIVNKFGVEQRVAVLEIDLTKLL